MMKNNLLIEALSFTLLIIFLFRSSYLMYVIFFNFYHLGFSFLQDISNWPLIDPLPSYGRGRELPGGRYMSLIHGNQLQDVIITGMSIQCFAYMLMEILVRSINYFCIYFEPLVTFFFVVFKIALLK